MSVAGTRPVLLYCHPSMDKLAKAIIEDVSAQSAGSNRHYRRVELKSDGIRWEHFKDGWPNLFIDDVKQCAGKDVIFIASFHSQAVVFDQLSVIYAFPRYLAHSFTLILPYFPTGTMERVDTEGQVATARTFSKLLSNIPLTARGPAQVVIYDIHALQERFYFTDNVIPRLDTAIPLVIDRFSKLPDREKVTIAFPDEGAYKRFHLLFPGWPTITCSKKRDGDSRVVTITEGEARDRHVVIVDDLVMTGGTLIECAKEIRECGASAISAYVTHAVFPRQSWKRFTEEASTPSGTEPAGHQRLFKHFWVTDSLPTVSEYVDQEPFELLSLSAVITNALLSYDLQQ